MITVGGVCLYLRYAINMSRCYSWHGDTLVRRPEQWVRKYTDSWAAARQRRSQDRTAAGEQTRNDGGFIVKRIPDGVRLHDPGRIDRYLWMQAHAKEE